MACATDDGPIMLYLPTGGFFLQSHESSLKYECLPLFKPIYLIQDHLMFSFSVEMPNLYVNSIKLLNAMITCGNELIVYAHAVQLFLKSVVNL